MGWRPWRADDWRLDEHVELVELPVDGLDALYATDGETWVILVDSRLPAVERLAAITHELVHHERGGGCHGGHMPAGWSPVALREEARVEAIVAERLVPRRELVQFVNSMLGLEMPVTADDVACEFEVPVPVARRALDHLSRTTA